MELLGMFIFGLVIGWIIGILGKMKAQYDDGYEAGIRAANSCCCPFYKQEE